MKARFLSAAPVYPVTDVMAAVAWYEATLGFEVDMVAEPEGAPACYAVLCRDAVSLHLVLAGSEAEGATGTFVHRSPVDAQLQVAGLEELAEALRGQDVTFFQELQEQPWGGRDLALLDPDGNKVWLSEP